MVAELWEGRGLKGWLRDSTPLPKLSFTLLAYGKFELSGHSGQRLPVQFSALCPYSAHGWLPHQRAKVQENMQKTTNLGKSGPGWLTPRGPHPPSRLVSYQEEAPGRDMSAVWEHRTQERKADRHTGSEDRTERPENTLGWSWDTLRCPVAHGGGWCGLGAAPTPDSPRQQL